MLSFDRARRTALLTVLGLSIAGTLPVSSALAETVWDMPTPYPEAEFHTQNIRLFAEDVARLSGGQLKLNVHSAQSLFKHPEIKRAVRTGQVPIGEMLMANLQNEDAIFGVDVVPFLATSHKQAEALWKAQRSYVDKALKSRGLQLLYAVPWPGQGFYVKREVNRVADLNGVKFRTYNAATARLAELMGAIPTIVEAVEIPQAFATGIVDAMVTSGATGVRAKAWDFVDNFYDLNAWLPKNMVIVNTRMLRSLPAKERDALMKAAALAEARGWDMSREAAESSIKTLSESRMNVLQPSDELVSELKELGRQMVQEWQETAGADGKALLDAYTAKPQG